MQDPRTELRNILKQLLSQQIILDLNFFAKIGKVPFYLWHQFKSGAGEFSKFRDLSVNLFNYWPRFLKSKQISDFPYNFFVMEFLGKLHCLVNYYSSVNQIVLWVNKFIFYCNHYFSLETFTVGDKFKVVLPIEKLLCLVKLIKTSFPRKITLIKLLLCHN